MIDPRDTIHRGIVASPDHGWDRGATSRIGQGKATAHDIMSHLDHAGNSFWHHHDHGDLEDAKNYANAQTDVHPKTWIDEGRSGRAYGEVGVVLEGKRPHGWHPDENLPGGKTHDPERYRENGGDMMGHSYLPRGHKVELTGVHYTDSKGDWHRADATGHHVTAVQTPLDITPSMMENEPHNYDQAVQRLAGRNWASPGDEMTHMHPRDLMPHILQGRDLDHNLADSMREHGWNPNKGKRFMRQRGNFHEDENPVTLWHHDHGSFVEPGNHRVPAANAAGLTSIPVLIKDRRTKLSAQAFTPTKRVFTHTCGLDHRLFDNEKLRPEVRKYILSTLGQFWKSIYGVGWDEWAMVYFAGSEASEWTSETLEGNNDFDVLVGVDYDKFRKHQASSRNSLEYQMTDEEITARFNEQFRKLNNPAAYITVAGTRYGPFDNTWYVNQDSYDIAKIKPYAAYNVSEDRWAVKPPHLPHWSLSELPGAVRRVLRACDRLANDILKLPEPERTQQGSALFDAWHSDRSRAFGPNGQGWYDIANLREKWLDQEGIWTELVNCKHRFNAGLGAALPGWSNDPTRKSAVHIDDYHHDPDRTWFHGSPNKFHEFGDLKGSQSGDWNASLGHHFSSEEDVAKSFGKHLYKAKLPMEKPKIYRSEREMDDEVMHHEHQNGNHYTKHLDPSFKALTNGNGRAGWTADEHLRKGDVEKVGDNSHHWLSKHPDRKNIVDRYRSRLQSAGHDGIIYGNDWESPGHASAIAFPGKPIVPIKKPKGELPASHVEREDRD